MAKKTGKALRRKHWGRTMQELGKQEQYGSSRTEYERNISQVCHISARVGRWTMCGRWAGEGQLVRSETVAGMTGRRLNNLCRVCLGKFKVAESMGRG